MENERNRLRSTAEKRCRKEDIDKKGKKSYKSHVDFSLAQRQIVITVNTRSRSVHKALHPAVLEDDVRVTIPSLELR
ncbi:hypothetical protein RRG08_038375 [Elysia crispata]|uniref:Uncharacterized protein n=1 Tax=Elysia crispata TaxID=231223 RepID=A0AAE1DTL7_9GAST|nr:hypothetical protein RRG08_038375 [Elysia crispata]